MSPIFLVNSNYSQTKLSLFEKYKVPNGAPAEMDDVLLSVYANKLHKHAWAYKNMKSIISAQLTGGVAKVIDQPQPHLKEITLDLLGAPIASFQFNDLTDEQRTELMSYGLTMRDRQNLYFGSPSTTNFRKILAMGPSGDTKFVSNVVSPDSYLSYMQMFRGAMVFSELSHSLYSNTAENLVTQPSNVSEYTSTVAPLWSQINGSQSLTSATGYVHGVSIGYICETYYTPYNTTKMIKGAYVSSNSHLPSQHDGAFFPYFHGMVSADKTSAFHTFEALFSDCLADTDNTQEQLQKVRIGAKKMAGTPAGLMLSHMYKGVKTAKDSCTILTFIFDHGSYKGFVIQGPTTMKIYHNKVSHSPVTYDALESEISNFDANDSKITAVVDLFNNIGHPHATQRTYVKEDLNTSRKIANMLMSVALNEYPSDFEKNLIKVVEGFADDMRFAEVSYDNIMKFLRYVETGDLSLLSGYGALLDDHLLRRDRVSVGLAIFGLSAPSLNYGPPTGVVYDLSSVGTDPNLTVGPLGVAKLRYLPFSNKPISAAAAQWNNLFSDCRFKLPPAPKNKKGEVKGMTDMKHVDFQVGGSPNFPTMYGLIKSIAVRTAKEVAGGKRKRDGNDQAGPSKKKDVKDMKKTASFV